MCTVVQWLETVERISSPWNLLAILKGKSFQETVRDFKESRRFSRVSEGFGGFSINFNGFPRDFKWSQGISRDFPIIFPGISRVFGGVSWVFMDFQGISIHLKCFQGILRVLEGFQRISKISRGFQDFFSWDFNGFYKFSRYLRGFWTR